MRRFIIPMVILIGFTGILFPGVLDEYSQACVDGDSNSCCKLAIAYRDGDVDNGVRQDAVASRQFLEIACNMGNTKACDELNNVDQNHKKSDTNIREVEDNKLMKHRDACDRGDGSGCYNLGLLYNQGKEVQKNNEKANQLYLRACELQNDEGCLTMASYYESTHNVIKAINFYIETCERSGAMCRYLALWYEVGGDGLDKDLKKAIKYYQKDCLFGEKDSCKKVEEISQLLDSSQSKSSSN